MKKTAAFFSLFGSFSTLICCALPALLVSVGAGATLASVLTAVPQLIWVSEHKNLVFAVAGIFILLGGIAQYRARNEPCPLDPDLARACTSARRLSLVIYIISLAIYFIGAGFAFVPELLAN